MKAMILAAGYGKRLNPLTLDLPKPLLKIGKETLLSNTLKFLADCKISQVVINVHYLRKQIIDYVKKNNFDLKISIVEEKERILDTGGGILNAINNFSNEEFIIINPDTIWNSNYIEKLNLMKKNLTSNHQFKCSMLVVKKEKSFDKNFKGDFNLKNNLINRSDKGNLNYIYTGLQIIKPEAFKGFVNNVFSINDVWNKLIRKDQLSGTESSIDFFHVSDLNTYENLLDKLNIK